VFPLVVHVSKTGHGHLIQKNSAHKRGGYADVKVLKMDDTSDRG
jgi:hypothetical protein